MRNIIAIRSQLRDSKKTIASGRIAIKGTRPSTKIVRRLRRRR
jgi:hypothetical protein